MAMLRRSLRPNQEIYAWKYLGRFLGNAADSYNGHHYNVIRTIAGLYATHPLEHVSGSNMGDLCRRMCSEMELDALRNPGETEQQDGPMAKRLQYLLAADRSEICARVTRVVIHAKSKSQAVDYACLQKDLEYWPQARGKWGASFWGLGRQEDSQDKEDLPPEGDTE
jgi:CRISPR type I-E-associated protein CasB/Cse2